MRWWWRRVSRRLRSVTWGLRGSAGPFAVLVAASSVLAVTHLTRGGSSTAPLLAQMAPLAFGGLLLTAYRMRWLAVVVAAGIGADLLVSGQVSAALPSLVAVGITGVIAHQVAARRDRLGISGGRSEAMLVELRDRLRGQGEIPPLPPGWQVEVSLRSAGGASFAGDFVACSLGNSETGGQRLELALVDVSGKGVDAGTRALLLSGALGGLIGAVAPGRFLSEANRYLLRQDWVEGFATAVHLTLDLDTGEYVLESAGHPPAVHFDAGSGRWRLSAVEGPLLGVLEQVDYPQDRGVLRRGDALLLYTDGLVERPGRDIEVGIDRLLGAAERLVPRGGFRGSAHRLVDEAARDAGDDRALVLVWRS